MRFNPAILRSLRRRARLAPHELAHRAGVSRITVILLENGGSREPRLKTVAKVAKALGVSVDQLYERSTS